MEQTWTAKQYKRAAEVHYNTCNFMLKNIETEKKYKEHVYLDIYYISGYILECILKYFILEQQHKISFSKEELLSSDVWHHDINKLWVLACEKGHLNKNNLHDLTKKWNSELRYEAKNQDFTKILEHYTQTIVPIYNNIKNIY